MNNKFLVSTIFCLALIGCKSSIAPDPTTTISFIVAQPSHVKLEVENSYNTVVATLVDENKQAGSYSAALNATALPSGIYFATLECKGINSNYYSNTTYKMLLLK